MPPTFTFRPRLLDALRGYDRARFARDLGAGLTVGVVALPLAMAFAIASGLKPEAGLWTAILAGLVISLFGGSSVQIGGPAGAFIVIVYGILQRHGLANLMIATACAGVLLFVLGALKLGRLVRYVPLSIVVGFTNGIAVLIAASQIKDWLGLAIPKMPADFFAQLQAMAANIGSFNPYAFGLGLACVAFLFAWPRRWQARVPGAVVALVALTFVAWSLSLPVETIGSRFGSIPRGLPAFTLPAFSWVTVKELVSPIITIALLGAIESLLCARVADQLSNLPRHDPNQELMAQGIANVVTPFFGGMPATGTIARTVTNIRAGATSPVAGVIHALTLAGIVLVAGPLALLVPLPVLAGILFFVAWNMGEWREFAHLGRYSHDYRLKMLGTFALTVVFDLTVAMEVGLVAACVLFIRRMSSLFRVEPVPGAEGELRYRLYGSLFFGATAKIDPIVQAVETGPRAPAVVLDALHMVHLDTSGLDALRQLHKVVLLRDGSLRIENLHEQPLEAIARAGFAGELARHQASEEVAA
ncbi:STAS domain-containing protein [Ramlibacter sp. G-1-2-2]|uniref:STAS domain-containing protein n=1 Tax=Ramlibacter agri TaxID=2728837 RepID=A0A848H068_9BURK|nr:SulP family inorganic anion transporter [Ramlibacter agri]NML43837.1 STAS domain-containing protein [Ramlibacter agri]